MSQSAPRPASDFALLLAFTSVPTVVLLLLGAVLSGQASALLARLDAAEAGAGVERLVTGTVRPALGQALLQAPASGADCVAWEAWVTVSWPEVDSSKREVTRSRTVRSGGAALRFDVDDARAGLLATVAEPRLELLAPEETRPEPGIPPWADALTDAPGSDSTHERKSYASHEKRLVPGQVVSLFGVPVAGDAHRLTVSPGEEKLRVFLGSPDAWRLDARGTAGAARWLLAIGAVTGALSLALLAGLVRAWRRDGRFRADGPSKRRRGH